MRFCALHHGLDFYFVFLFNCLRISQNFIPQCQKLSPDFPGKVTCKILTSSVLYVSLMFD
ncbi:hypothetical protein Bca4012_032799 [Brassica carinata]